MRRSEDTASSGMLCCSIRGNIVSRWMDTGCEGVNHAGQDGYRAYLGGVALAGRLFYQCAQIREQGLRERQTVALHFPVTISQLSLSRTN